MGAGAGWERTGRASRRPAAPGTEEERQDLTTALGLVKELLSNVDQDVHELEKGARLQEIYHRMDPRAQAPVPGKGPFGREELLRRRLIHDGCLLWKTATGRFKGQCQHGGQREPRVRHGEGGASSLRDVSAALRLRPRGREMGALLQQSLNSVFDFVGRTGLPCQGGSLRARRATGFDEEDRETAGPGDKSRAASRAVEQASGRQPGKAQDRGLSRRRTGRMEKREKSRGDWGRVGRGVHFPGLPPHAALVASFLLKAGPGE